MGSCASVCGSHHDPVPVKTPAPESKSSRMVEMKTPRDDLLPEQDHGFDYDLIVIGGGSGGLAASKAAADLGKKVAVLDFVRPSPQGTTWGLGGTCVNVGCIPKKLMHQASILGESLNDAKSYGWKMDGEDEEPKHDWPQLVTSIQEHIRSLNFNYRTDLRYKNVRYINGYGSFENENTVCCVDGKGEKTTLTARRFLIAVGGRPKFPNIPGAKEFGISSDDLFSLQKPPGKTLVVGASYVALECAGVLSGLGFDTTVMIRSVPLRGFDQECAWMITDYMSNHGRTKFIYLATPVSLEKTAEGKILVKFKREQVDDIQMPEIEQELYDTVLFATGREAETKSLNLSKIGIQIEKESSKIVVNEFEQTSVAHIYAIGDVVQGRPELTPVAIAAGKLLISRLYSKSKQPLDYTNILTTVFTPLEYGCVGLPEEQAIEKLGPENVEVFHSFFTPLEWTIPHRGDNSCYAKLVCDKQKDNVVVGFHVLGPNAGEITQGFALGIKMGAKKKDFDDLIGIHPTTAEEFTVLSISKNSGQDASKAGC